MFDYIEKLRGKSERTKKLVAAGVAFFCAAIIFAFWIFSVMPNFAQQQQISARVQSYAPSPVSAFGQILSQGAAGIGGEISKLKSAGSFLSGMEIINNTTTTPAVSTTTNSMIATTSPLH
jgi:hypothetical protein